MKENNVTMGLSAAELLQRTTPPVYGDEAKALITGKTILVTGAGGSIGSEIVRQIRRLGPRAVYYVDHDEYALYNLELSLTAKPLLTGSEYILADITDRVRMHTVFSTITPDIVFHAAAYKHLPLLERSPSAGVKNNIFGSQVIAEMCIQYNVKRLINISTDKAARPTSVLGMTKRLAEIAVAHRSRSHTKVASVRFGNVLGSRGSFLETLAFQIKNGFPVTITDSEMNRYFMTIPEAAGLVIESAVIAESGCTYVLDMGESIRIVDLVMRYSQLIDRDPLIIFTGRRPGEKLSEELFDPSETFKETSNRKIWSVAVATDVVSQTDLNDLYSLSDFGTSVDHLREVLMNMLNLEARVA